MPAAYPDVPVLVLNGLEDDNTPPDDARKVAALFPHASLLLVPDAGHDVAQSQGASSGCVKDRIAQFFAGQQVVACPAVRPRFAIWPTPPRSLAAVKPAKNVAGTRGRTLGAVIDTVNDSYNTIYYTVGPNAGLRGGTFTTSSDRKILTFKNVSYVPGVVINGSIDVTTALGMFKVTGKGSHGTLFYRAKYVVTGTLDGKTVKTTY